MKLFVYFASATLCLCIVFTGGCAKPEVQDAAIFVKDYTAKYQPLYYEWQKAAWLSSTDIKDENTRKEIEARKKYVEFVGSKDIIEKAKAFLAHKDRLNAMLVKQLEVILYYAAGGPATIPDITQALVETEARQTEALFGFEFKIDDKKVTPNEIDNMLLKETDVNKRLKIWESTKEVGKVLKDGLVKLQDLRNKVAREMGYTSYFDKETSDYGMKAEEMVLLMDKVNEELKPLYAELYTWVKYKLAQRYNQPVPEKMPAHWLPNRWSQEWPGIVDSIDLDSLFKDKKPEWIVKKAEEFYVSMGLPELPQVFWDKSDLYPVSADSPRKKNTHASAWHLDLDHDVRSLMSVENNANWFKTTHHELGHIYYYLLYSNPHVPVLLRDGANRGFHEGIGELISIASMQTPYLQEIKLLPADAKIDKIQWLLNEALEGIVFLPWAAGVMTHFEYDLYEKNLPKEEYNKRWWFYVEKYQGIVPPSERGEEYCDAATKTHINDDPAQYYDYAVAQLLKFQFHYYICRNILKASPDNANYYNRKDVGEYLRDIMTWGKTADWRELLKEKTGEDLNARTILEYFKPLMNFLKKENHGRKVGF